MIPNNVCLPPLECCLGTSPSGQLPAILEVFCIANGSNQRTGGKLPDAWQLCQFLTDGTLLMPTNDRFLQLVDLFIEGFDVLVESHQ